MSLLSKFAELHELTKGYSRELGWSRAPKLELGPGWRCAYSLAEHRITMGVDVLHHASPATCKAVLAHEVGHSAEPLFRLWYWAARTLPVLCLLMGLFLILSYSHGPVVAGGCLAVALLVLAFVWAYPVLVAKKYLLAMELSADRRAAKLVGADVMHAALEEYARLANGGNVGKIGQIRRAALEQMMAQTASNCVTS